MEKKKRIAILTLMLFLVGVILAFFDALVGEVYQVIPEQRPATGFKDLVLSGPIWWKINSSIQTLIIFVGIVSYLLGASISKRSIRFHFTDILLVIFTFLIISASGFGDIIAQSFIEILRGNNPFFWIGHEWWWTTYLPLPWLLTVVSGLVYPTGMTMLVGSVIGIALLVSMWAYYLKFYKSKGGKPEEEHFVMVK